MLSRVADSIFWMSRYMERSTFLLRVVKTHYIGSQEDIQYFDWISLLNSYGTAGSKDSPKPLQQVLESLILEKENIGSVYNNIKNARENARAIQDHITKEVWQILNDYYHLIRERNIQHYLSSGDPITALDLLIRQSILYSGMVDSTMARGEGFNFLNIGKFLERALQNTRLLLLKTSEVQNMNQSDDTAAWRYFLFSLSGYELYLKTNREGVRPNLVIYQAVQSPDFPHSLSYCLRQVNRYFQRLQTDSPEESFRQMDFQIGKTISAVKYNHLKEMGKESLMIFLNQVRTELFDIANGFNKYYFGLS